MLNKSKIINVEQGSPAWLSLRKNKITATDTAKIMGLNPWCTPYGLWEEKLDFRESQALNDKMKEGSLLEDEARHHLNEILDSDFKPVVLESRENSFQIASLDGMNSSGQILEIKCGASSYEMAKKQEIPPYYFSQLQKQMWVAEVDRVIYMCYRSDGDRIHWIVNRDDKFIEKMNEQEKVFYDCLMNLIPPELTDKDYVIKKDLEWYELAYKYKKAKNEYNKWKIQEECLKNELIRLSGGMSCKGNGIIVSKVIRKGNIDYNSINELKSIDLEKYRKGPTTYMSVRDG